MLIFRKRVLALFFGSDIVTFARRCKLKWVSSWSYAECTREALRGTNISERCMNTCMCCTITFRRVRYFHASASRPNITSPSD